MSRQFSDKPFPKCCQAVSSVLLGNKQRAAYISEIAY